MLTDLSEVQALIDGDDDVESVDCDGDEVKAAYEAIRDNSDLDDETRKRAALLHYLACDSEGARTDDVEQAGRDENAFEFARREYLVYTDNEADEACADRIKDSLWAFNASFLSGETGIDDSVFEALAGKCEDANDAVLSIIKGTCGIDKFVDKARSADGRGHFLSSYDGEENESGAYYIYRTN